MRLVYRNRQGRAGALLLPPLGDGLAYRETFTTAADQVIGQLVDHEGLRLDRDSAPEPGKIVFIYRPVKVAVTG